MGRHGAMLLLSVSLVWAGCSGSSASGPEHPDGEASAESTPRASASGHGDGATCIQATEADRTDPKRVPPKAGDKSLEEFGETIKSVISHGSFLNACELHPSSTVTICVGVRDGAALGVTVKVDPGSQREADCVADAIRGLSFPSRPELVVANMGFAQGPR